MKPFREMTASELFAYEGPVYGARLQVNSRTPGDRPVDIDHEEPTLELLAKDIEDTRKHWGRFLSISTYQRQHKPKETA